MSSVFKTVDGASRPWVRIPPPPHFAREFAVPGSNQLRSVGFVQPTYSQWVGTTRDESEPVGIEALNAPHPIVDSIGERGLARVRAGERRQRPAEHS